MCQTDGSEPEWARPGELTGCLVKETLKAGSSLSGDGYILLRMKKPAPQQNRTPIISSTLGKERESVRGHVLCAAPQWTGGHTLTRSTIVAGWTGLSRSSASRSSPHRSDICNDNTPQPLSDPLEVACSHYTSQSNPEFAVHREALLT